MAVQNPMLTLIHEFLTKGHVLGEECLTAIKTAGTEEIEFSHTMLDCDSCGINMLNWLQLDRYQCPPKDYRNPLEVAERMRQNPTYNR